MHVKKEIDALVLRLGRKFKKADKNDVLQVAWLSWLTTKDWDKAYRFACVTLTKETDKALQLLGDVEAPVVVKRDDDVKTVINRAVIGTINALDEIDRKIFNERYILHKKLREVALTVGMSPTTVWRRAKKIVKIFLREYAKHDA